MYVSDAENAPYKKKKDSSTSRAGKRSDHEHYYAANVNTFKYCDGSTFTYRIAICIFCGRKSGMSRAKREKLEVFETYTYHQHISSSGHTRKECPLLYGNAWYRFVLQRRGRK